MDRFDGFRLRKDFKLAGNDCECMYGCLDVLVVAGVYISSETSKMPLSDCVRG